MNEDIKNYISEWDKEDGPKPKNDPKFIGDFLEFAKSSDFDQWEFGGENQYCGYTATLKEHPENIPVHGLGFEFAYGKDFVKVFTSDHNGFWVPEYISLSGEGATYLLWLISFKLNGWAGFGS